MVTIGMRLNSILALLDCNDGTFASILSGVKNTLTIIQIIVPILLIIMASISLFEMVNNPDEKKNFKKVLNTFIAAIVVFFIPMLVNVTMSMLGENSNISACWNNANYKFSSPSYQKINNNKKQSSIIDNPSDYEMGDEKKEEVVSDSNTSSNSNSGGKTPTAADLQGPVNATGKYGPALKGSGFHISGRSTTGGCASGQTVYHDLSIAEENPIYAGMDGTIEYIQYLCNGILYSYGNQARLTDSVTGTYILYGHLSQFVGASAQVTKTCHAVYGASAKCGAAACSSGISKKTILRKTIKRGELIGYTGNTGNSEGPHLHVEIHENGSRTCVTDPYAAMGMR